MAHGPACYAVRMRLVCAYCGKVVREDPGGRATDVSHGMCAECEEHFGRLWEGMSLSEYLETLGQPVVVVDADGRIVAANEKIAALSGRTKAELAGGRTGQAFACVRSRLPEGCGKTVHCRECTIRRAVAHVQETGEPLVREPAWVKIDGGRLDLRISVSAAQGLVKVLVEDAQPRAAAA